MAGQSQFVTSFKGPGITASRCLSVVSCQDSTEAPHAHSHSHYPHGTNQRTAVLKNPPLVTRSRCCHTDHSILAAAATVDCPRHQGRKSWLHCWRAVLCCGELQPLRLLDPHLQASGSRMAAAEQMATISARGGVWNFPGYSLSACPAGQPLQPRCAMTTSQSRTPTHHHVGERKAHQRLAIQQQIQNLRVLRLLLAPLLLLLLLGAA